MPFTQPPAGTALSASGFGPEVVFARNNADTGAATVYGTAAAGATRTLGAGNAITYGTDANGRYIVNTAEATGSEQWTGVGFGSSYTVFSVINHIATGGDPQALLAGNTTGDPRLRLIVGTGASPQASFGVYDTFSGTTVLAAGPAITDSAFNVLAGRYNATTKKVTAWANGVSGLEATVINTGATIIAANQWTVGGWFAVQGCRTRQYMTIVVPRALSDVEMASAMASLADNGSLFWNTVAADTTAPTLTGTITISAITQTTATLAWPAGADNVAIAGYDYSTNGGTSYIQLANVLTVGLTGLTAATTYPIRVRARDAAGNLSTPVLSASLTTASAAAGTLTTPVIKNNTGTVLASETGVVVNVYDATTGALVVRKTAQTSNASGIVTITDALLVAGTTYAYEVVLSANGRRLPVVVVA